MQKRITVVSDVAAATASSLMVRAALARGSARTFSATRSSAGDNEGRSARSRTSSGAVPAPGAGSTEGRDVMRSTYDLSAAPGSTLAG